MPTHAPVSNTTSSIVYVTTSNVYHSWLVTLSDSMKQLDEVGIDSFQDVGPLKSQRHFESAEQLVIAGVRVSIFRNILLR
jgi:hypothetical protein